MKTEYLVSLAVVVPLAVFGATVLVSEFDHGSPGDAGAPANHVVRTLHPNSSLILPSRPIVGDDDCC